MTTAGMDLAYWIMKAMAEVGFDPLEPGAAHKIHDQNYEKDADDPAERHVAPTLSVWPSRVAPECPEQQKHDQDNQNGGHRGRSFVPR